MRIRNPLGLDRTNWSFASTHQVPALRRVERDGEGGGAIKKDVSSRGSTIFKQFKSLSLFGCPPVGHRHFEFSPGVNLLIGGNGTGKSSIAAALRTGRWPYGGGVRIDDPDCSNDLLLCQTELLPGRLVTQSGSFL